MKLRLLDGETKQVEEGEATTDKDGNASLPADDDARWVFAERESDGHLVAINNEFYSDLPLSLSMGLATSQHGERLEAVVKRADLAMLAAKREHYARMDTERRVLSAS